jgi:hypothetical protein
MNPIPARRLPPLSNENTGRKVPEVGPLLPGGELHGLDQLHTLVGDVGERGEGEHGPDPVQPHLQLAGELEEVGDEPEEVGLVQVHGGVVLRQLLEQFFYQAGVARQQEVQRELHQQLRDVLAPKDGAN